MILFKNVELLSLASLFLIQSSNALPHHEFPLLNRRDDSDVSVNATVGNETSTILHPVIPPAIDPEDLDILKLDTSVTLAWARPTTQHKRKRSDGIFSQANLTFAYPTIPLDYSNYVSDISCKVGRLTARLSDGAYDLAKSAWKGKGPIILVTAVDGCGDDDTNEFFITKSITFSDKDHTFTAKGLSVGYRDVVTHFDLAWGNVGTLKLKRSMDKRDIFQPHALHPRVTLPKASWDIKLSDPRVLGVDSSAPWENAALLYKYGKAGGTKDNSFSKGQVSNQDNSTFPPNPKKPASVDYGLGLIAAKMQMSRPFVKVSKVQTGFDATFRAAINLGLEAYVKYGQKYEQVLQRYPLTPWNIPGLADIGPFVDLSVEASAEIKTTGQFLMGSTAEWDNVNARVDFLDSSNSYANGFVPSVSAEARASGQVGVRASLGMPLRLGVGVNIFHGLWVAEGAVKDTPSASAGASFQVSTDTNAGTDINGGCYGVTWNVGFDNSVTAVVDITGLTTINYPLTDPMTYEVASGCIGYKKPTDTTCSPTSVVPNPRIPKGQTCKKSTALSRPTTKSWLGAASPVKDLGTCATKCFKNSKCISFSMSKKKSCQMYTSSYKSLKWQYQPDYPELSLYDRACYAYQVCN
ncbi:hypothetical protein ACKRZS_013238 [Fusarium odoratissimum]